MTTTIPLEVKKHGYRQTQDGIVISFVVHPNDITPELAASPLGTRYAVALVEIGDDERPVIKPKRGSLAQQAGILCDDVVFRTFLAEKYQSHAFDDSASVVRNICNVSSRAEFDADELAGNRWKELVREYNAWKLL